MARRLQSGDLAARSPLDSGDELGHLAATLNAMAAKLGLTIERMEIVRAASLDLASELDTETVMDRALAVATTLSNAEIGFVGLTEGDDLFLARAIGPLRSVQVGDPLPCDVDTLAGIVRTAKGLGASSPNRPPRQVRCCRPTTPAWQFRCSRPTAPSVLWCWRQAVQMPSHPTRSAFSNSMRPAPPSRFTMHSCTRMRSNWR